MANTTTLERPAIEDALFGEPRVLDVQDSVSPDGCFCICSCRTGSTKIPNSSNVSVDVAVSKVLPD